VTCIGPIGCLVCFFNEKKALETSSIGQRSSQRTNTPPAVDIS